MLKTPPLMRVIKATVRSYLSPARSTRVTSTGEGAGTDVLVYCGGRKASPAPGRTQKCPIKLNTGSEEGSAFEGTC